MGDYVAPVAYVPPGPSYLDAGSGAAGGTVRPEIANVVAAATSDALVAVWRHPTGSAAYLTRLTVQADTPCRAYVYVGERVPRNLVSGTNSGGFDENDPSQPYFVPEGTQVCIAWQTLTGTAQARIEYVAA